MQLGVLYREGETNVSTYLGDSSAEGKTTYEELEVRPLMQTTSSSTLLHFVAAQA